MLTRLLTSFILCSELQKGIVIIDSPGVGESREMDEMVVNYLPKAFAFIYVINSYDAGGIQERVSTLGTSAGFKCAFSV